jgi:phosphoglycerol transferase
MGIGKPMTWKSALKAFAAYGGATILCLVILVSVLKLWKTDLSDPLIYNGDALYYGMCIKRVVEKNWYLRNDNLGMPFGQEMYDFPMVDSLHFLVIKGLSILSDHPLTLYNLYFLLTFPLTTLTALFVFRHFNLSYLPAILCALLYAFLPFHIFRALYHCGHLFLAAYYLVPPMVMVLLRLFLDQAALSTQGEDTNERRLGMSTWGFVASILICIAVSSAGVYYASFACFFLLVAAVGACVRGRTFGPIIVGGVLIAVIILGVLANLTPTLIYQRKHGPNPAAVCRTAADSEIHGMKISQLLLPITGHRLGSLAKLKETYNKAPLVAENDSTALGMIGAFGFLTLLSWLLFRKKEVNRPLKDGLSLLNISAVLLATIGGLGSVFSLLVSPYIRCYNRMCVYVAFFSLFAVALLLDRFSRRYVQSLKAHLGFGVLLVLLLAAGILDQSNKQFPPPPGLKVEFDSDAHFVNKIEALLPERAMVYQLPAISFPEYGPVCQHMENYDHLRGYLHSKTLRWSYGAMRSREGDLWQQSLNNKPVDELVRVLSFAGFCGIYIDRFAYADYGRELESTLRKLLGNEPIVSNNGRLAFFDMTRYKNTLQASYSAEQWQLEHEHALRPLGSSMRHGHLTKVLGGIRP